MRKDKWTVVKYGRNLDRYRHFQTFALLEATNSFRMLEMCIDHEVCRSMPLYVHSGQFMRPNYPQLMSKV